MSAIVLGLAVLAFCVWAVSLGGLAALQDSCGGDFTGASLAQYGITNCDKAFRWEWFIICFDFVVVVAVMACAVTGAYHKVRQSLLALTAMVTLLYMILANTWLAVSDGPLSGDLEDRVNTMAAGTIMVAAVNCLLVIALGLATTETVAHTVEHKTAAAV